jgi:hypothetical protein
MKVGLAIAALFTSAGWIMPTLPAPPPPDDEPPARPTPKPQVAARDIEPATPAVRENLVPAISSGLVKLQVFGSLRPTFGLVQRDTTSARDRWDYGAAGSRIDLGADAKAGHGVSAIFYMKLGSSVSEDDNDAKVEVERAIVRWQPIKELRLSAGRDRVPLSAQGATPTAARVFPSRIALDSTYTMPIDVGVQSALTTPYVTASLGVWNGLAGDTMLAPGAEERGLLYSSRLEITPLGSLDFDETHRDCPLRFGIGTGATYRAASTFSPTGAEGMRSRDLRVAVSARMAWKGLLLQTEVLRKQITDDLSERPDIATGGYVQASWRFGVSKIEVAPLFRAGIDHVRQLTAPATGSSVEAGGAIFPFGNTDRLVLVALWTRQQDPDLRAENRLTGQLRVRF